MESSCVHISVAEQAADHLCGDLDDLSWLNKVHECKGFLFWNERVNAACLFYDCGSRVILEIPLARPCICSFFHSVAEQRPVRASFIVEMSSQFKCI